MLMEVKNMTHVESKGLSPEEEEVLREDSEGELNVGQFSSISAVSSGQTFV